MEAWGKKRNDFCYLSPFTRPAFECLLTGHQLSTRDHPRWTGASNKDCPSQLQCLTHRQVLVSQIFGSLGAAFWVILQSTFALPQTNGTHNLLLCGCPFVSSRLPSSATALLVFGASQHLHRRNAGCYRGGPRNLQKRTIRGSIRRWPEYCRYCQEKYWLLHSHHLEAEK